MVSAATIIAIIITFGIVALIGGAIQWGHYHTEEMSRAGCTPTTWDQFGNGWNWRCPAP